MLSPFDLFRCLAPGLDGQPPKQDRSAHQFDDTVNPKGHEQGAPCEYPCTKGDGSFYNHPADRKDSIRTPVRTRAPDLPEHSLRCLFLFWYRWLMLNLAQKLGGIGENAQVRQ